MNKHLVILDFDGTMAKTMEPSPHGMNVPTACKFAITDLFGQEGYVYYNEILGGLRNREPGELIRAMLRGLRISEQLQSEATEEFVEGKLSYLLPEINKDWPRLYPGVKDFFKKATTGEIPVDIGIVSSGHDRFIKRFLEMNDIPSPDILVTSDILRKGHMPERDRHKPNPYQLAVAHRLWQLAQRDVCGGVTSSLEKDRMVYVGDDPVKDGELAQRSRIPFVYVPFTKDGYAPRAELGQIQARSFNELSEVFARNADKLRNGAGMSEVFFGKSYAEVFPPLQEGQRLYDRLLVEGRNGRSIERI